MLVCSMRVYNYYRQHYYTNIKGRLPPITKIIRRNKNARISFFVFTQIKNKIQQPITDEVHLFTYFYFFISLLFIYLFVEIYFVLTKFILP